MTRGTFITFEGPEGGGKSTQLSLLAEYLRTTGHKVVVTREPGGTPLGQRIRELLLDPGGAMTARSELLLMNAARAEHVDEVIGPALDDGFIVLSDRYEESSLAYQGFGRELGVEAVKPVCDFATGGLRPDLVLLLDIEAGEGLGRNRTLDAKDPSAAENKNNRFEAETLDFHRRVRQGFLELAKREPDRFEIIDAGRSSQEVEAAVRKAVAARLGLT